MLGVNSRVTHPMFPNWGMGVIVDVLYDNVSGKRIAKVMWQSLATDKLAFHALDNLQKADLS